jgi:hypothetical protein
MECCNPCLVRTLKKHSIRFTQEAKSTNWLFAAAFFLLPATNVEAQWTAISGRSTTRVLVQLQDQAKQISMAFPGCDNCKAIAIGDPVTIEPGEFQEEFRILDWQKKMPGFHQVFHGAVRLNWELGHMTMLAYVKNVKRCMVFFRDNRSRWLVKEISFAADGYCKPISTYFKTWEYFPTSNQELDQSLELAEIYIQYEPRNAATRSQFVIGKLQLSEYQSYTKGDDHPWVVSLTSGAELSDEKMLDDYSRWSLSYLAHSTRQLPTFDQFGTETGVLAELINFKCDGPNCDEKAFLKQVLTKSISLFPFYKRLQLDSAAVAKKVSTYFDQNEGYGPEFLEGLRSTLARELRDPHMDVLIPESEQIATDKVRGPLRLKAIGGNVAVVANFDVQFENDLPPGSIVTRLNRKPVTCASDFNTLLQLRKSDTLEIEFYQPGDRERQTLKLPYSNPLRVTPNYRSRHEYFEYGPDSIAYIQLTNWTKDCSYLFANHIEEISKSKGLIIDLRGNGGGFATDVMNTLSFFFSKPQVIGEMGHYWFKESIIVYPNHSSLRFPETLKVITLVDNATACGSEIFLLGMSNRANSFVVGETNTQGAIASPTLYRFPSGLMLKIHTRLRQFIFDEHAYKEGVGITPTLFVSRTHARDLYPFEDKVRKLATQYLKSYN